MTSLGMPRRSQGWLAATVLLAGLGWGRDAAAQYRNYTFGFEGGYALLTEGTALKLNNFALGLFGGWKSSDHWWFSGRAMLSFPGQLDNAPNTVVLLHIVPISVQYYFKTDDLRPYVGLTNSFQITFNSTDSVPAAMWGPGVTAGTEIKLRRDLFLGLKADGFWMLRFGHGPPFLVTATAQLIFFL